MEDGKLRNELTIFQAKIQEMHVGENNAEKMRELFIPIAKRLLQGGYFEVSSESNVIRRIFPYTVEFYYHEEEVGGLKDYIVYHRNSDNPSKKPIEPFLINSFHTHLSGIDVTFEGKHRDRVFRASALIRAFQVLEGEDGFPTFDHEDKPAVNGFSTYLYNNLFMGIDIEKGLQVRWKNLDWAPDGQLHNGYRYNVCKYEDIKPTKPNEWERHVKMTKKNHPDTSPQQMQDDKPWAFSRGEFKDLCKIL